MDKPLITLPIFLLFAIISMAFGRKLLALLKVKAESRAESLVFGIGLGLGVLAYLVLAVGLAGLLFSWTLLAIIVVMALVSLREISQVLMDVVNSLRSRAVFKLKTSDGLIAVSMVSLGAIALIASLAPPSGMDWDGLAYHFAIPKMYLAKHAIFYVPFISHSNFPFLTEMLYTIGLSLGSTSIAKLFHFTMYISSAMAVYALGRRHVNRLTGSIAAVLFMSIPVVLWEAGLAYADITTALYITLAAYAALNWEQNGSSRWLVVCGLMCGFALGTKVLSAVPTAALCIWILVSSWRSGKWGRGVSLALITGGIALLVGSPWYIKSYIYTGNPVYPFLYNIFGGRYWNQADADMYRNAQLAFGMGRSLRDLLLVPWNLAMNGFRFFDNKAVCGLIGAAFIGLIPVGLLAGKLNKTVLKLGFVLAAFLAAWFILMQQSRYLIGVLPLACIMAASTVNTANSRWTIGRHAVNIFVVLCVTLSILVGIVMSANVGPVVTGAVSRDEFLSGTLDVYDAQVYINDVSPKDAKVVLFDEVRGFYLDREYIWGNPGHHEMIPWKSFKTGKDMVEYFIKHDYNYCLINWQYAGSDFMHNTLITEAIGRSLMSEVYASNGVSVYEFSL